MASLPVLLRPVGFWSTRPGDGLPDPASLAPKSWETPRRDVLGADLKPGRS